MTWVACLRGWCACVGDVLAWVAWMTSLCEERARMVDMGGQGDVLVWVEG